MKFFKKLLFSFCFCVLLTGSVAVHAGQVDYASQVVNGGDWYWDARVVTFVEDPVSVYDITESTFTTDISRYLQGLAEEGTFVVNDMSVVVTSFNDEYFEQTVYEGQLDPRTVKCTFSNCEPGVTYVVTFKFKGHTYDYEDSEFECPIHVLTYGEYGDATKPIKVSATTTNKPVEEEPTEEVIPPTTVKPVVPTIKKVTLSGPYNTYFQWQVDKSIARKVDGLEWRIINKNTKKTVDKGNSYSTSDYTILPMYKTGLYYLQMRSFVYDDMYNRVYSSWTKASNPSSYAISSVSLNESKTKKSIKKNSVRLYWKAVKGAKSYTVYGRHKKSGKWYKIKETKNTNLNVSKIHGKTINTRNHVYFRVVTNAKVGSKTIKSNPYEVDVYSYYVYK